MDDDDKLLIFDEVDMQDIMNEWAKQYAEGVEVSGWYYDCHSQTVIVRVLADDDYLEYALRGKEER